MKKKYQNKFKKKQNNKINSNKKIMDLKKNKVKKNQIMSKIDIICKAKQSVIVVCKQVIK